MIKRQNLTRKNFEKLIKGIWVKDPNSNIRRNGDFLTKVEKGFKYCSDGVSTIRGKNWHELAKALKLTELVN